MNPIPETWRTRAVLEATGLSRTTLCRRVRAGDFPPAIRLGGPESRCVGWHRRDVEAWVSQRDNIGRNQAA